MPDIPGDIAKRIASRIKAYPCHANRASSIGATCMRQLVYARRNWGEAELPSVSSKRIFELGETVEEHVIRAMQDAGYQVVEQQRALDDFADVQLTGHVDGVLLIEGKAIPFDVKSMSPHIWGAIFKRGEGVYEWWQVSEGFESRPWLKKYRAQIQLYALCKNAGYGLLICYNKSTGELAQVNCALDIDYCDSLLERCKTINAHVEAGTYPERIPWDADECGHCSYLHLCLPDRVGRNPVAFLVESEIGRLCAAREASEAAALAFEDADKRLKAWAKEQEWERCLVKNDEQMWEVLKAVGRKSTRVTIRRFPGGSVSPDTHLPGAGGESPPAPLTDGGEA